MVRIVLPICVAFLAACGPSIQPGEAESEVTLAVEPTAVSPGGSVVLTLANDSPDRLGYNLCTSTLEVRDGAAWKPVPSDRVCTMELRMLGPGRTVGYPRDVPTGLAPGEYRFVTTVEQLGAGERVSVASDSFTVGR